MNSDHLSQHSDRLDQAVRFMQASDTGALPEELREGTRKAVLQAATHRRRRMVGLRALAASLLGVLGLAAFLSPLRSSQAFAEMAARVNATRTVKAVVVDPREGGTLLVSGTRTRFEGNGAAVIADASKRQEVMLDSRSLLAYRIPQRGLSRALDFYGIFRDLAAAASTPIPAYTDAHGRHCPGTQGRAALKIGGDATWNVDAKVWSDPATKLPTRMEIRPVEDGGNTVILLEQIEFDVALEERLFDMTIPPGYKIVGLSEDQLKPAPSADEAAKLTITPGVGIGDVKFGMSREQIVAILGEPEFTQHDVYLNYSSMGLQLVLSGRESDKFDMIIANPGDAASLVRREFPGQTDQGIRIGSSEQQVIDAYGQPDPRHPESPAHHHYAAYKKLGLSMSLRDGKVVQIIASRTD